MKLIFLEELEKEIPDLHRLETHCACGHPIEEGCTNPNKLIRTIEASRFGSPVHLTALYTELQSTSVKPRKQLQRAIEELLNYEDA